MKRMATPRPDVLFLGLAERAAYVRDGNTNLFKWNVLGLKHIVLSPIYPLRLSGFSAGFAFVPQAVSEDHKFWIVDQTGKEAGFITLSARTASPNDPDAAINRDGPLILVPGEGWSVAFLPIGMPAIVISAPGLYQVLCDVDGSRVVVGQLHFVAVDSPELTHERITAIRSDPTASKAVRIELGCNECPAKARAYVALDRSTKSEAEGWTWYRDLPDEFLCECGKTKMPLRYIRQNLHGLIGTARRGTQEIDFLPLYERSSLESVRSTFAALLDSKPAEEILQQFLATNPILFHQFAALRLFSKPPILTFFVADFAVLTPSKELILVELEKTTTRLLKKDGGLASPVSHAFDQLRDWLHVVDEHRLAVLDTLKIEREEVGSIRGVVIAGRDAGYDAHHLRKLKGEDRGRVTLLTYDDLLFALAALIGRMEGL